MKKLLVSLVAAAAMVAACSDETPSTPPTIASVTMVPTADSAVGGDSMLLLPTPQLAAVVRDASGNVLSVIQTGQPVVWTSNNPTVAKVSRYGRVRGLTLGSAIIIATVGGKSDSASATVDSLVIVDSVDVTDRPDTAVVGSSVTLTATLTAANGDTLTAQQMFWSSSDTSVAKVTSNDVLGVSPGNTAAIKGVKAGTVTITATIQGVSGTASVIVLP